MQVLKHGNLPSLIKYGKCSNCGCVVTFSTDEYIVQKFTERNVEQYCVPCPTTQHGAQCGRMIYGKDTLPE